MRTQLFFMVLATVGCLAAAYLGVDSLRNAPNIILVINMRSVSAFVGWAYVLFMALLPIVCVVSILWGWFSYFSDKRAAALGRIMIAPALIGGVCLALYALARILPQGL